MPKKPQQLAKLSRPRLYDALPRERLFALLDEKRSHPVVWVVGPPGSGKTTLVASYWEKRKLSGVWYQLDAGDADPAAFFYYLGVAFRSVQKGRRSKTPLPLLTPEYLQDIPGFARRFFRDLFRVLGPDTLLVLDNFQSIPEDGALHGALAAALEEIPQNSGAVIVSRSGPSHLYARLAANQSMNLVDWDQLKLTRDEAHRILGTLSPADDFTSSLLHEHSGGWVAGLMLLAERLRRGVHPEHIAQPDSLHEVFGYFAGQIFDREASENQQILLELGFLSRMTEESVRVLTGKTAAARLLDQLYRRHLFTDRRSGKEAVYQFHSLFRAFLRFRARQTLSAAIYADTARRAADLLEANGEIEDAMDLRIESQDMAGAEAIVLKEAARFIGQGRWRAIVNWTSRLPRQRLDASCWLLHWLGTAMIPIDPPESRKILEKSFEQARAQGDVECQLQSAAGIVQTYFLQYSQFRPLDLWIEALREGLDAVSVFPSQDAELRVRSALLIALAYRKPDDPILDECAERVFQLLDSGADPNLRLAGAAYLVAWGTVTGPIEVARRALPRLISLIELPEITALSAAWAWFVISYHHTLNVDYEKCAAAIQKVEQIGDEQGLPSVYRWAAIIGFWNEIRTYDLPAARECILRLEAVINPAHLYDVASVHWNKALVAVIGGEAVLALQHIKEAVEIFDRSGSMLHRTNARNCYHWAYVQLRDFENARKWIADTRKLASRLRSNYQEIMLRLSESNLELEAGNRALAMGHLRSAIVFAREAGCDHAFEAWLPPWKSRLMALALAGGIEEEYVRQLIRRFHWPAPSEADDAWPWPVRIYTLGVFRIEIDGIPLNFGRKTPKKPLALLKSIIAFGGSGVPEQKLLDVLWPDEDGDAARESFAVGLHRLRKLLVHSNVVQLADGLVSLAPAKCWVDVWSLERKLSAAERGNATLDAGAISQLYRGHFLADDSGAPWALPMMERLRVQFVRNISRAGRCEEDVGRHEDAMLLYQKGIEADDLAEELYQGLIRCYQSTGRTAEAMSVYRRLRQTLSVILGTRPSADTEALARTLSAS